MSEVAALPQEFALEVACHAIEPALSKGWIARFSTLRRPTEGRPVLIRISTGEHFIREYRPLPDGHFVAASTKPGYADFDSRLEDITIVAACFGYDIPERWSDKAARAN